MSTKIKYYQVNDSALMAKDKAHFTKFGYTVKSKSSLNGRDAVEITYYRDDKKAESKKLAELESYYDDAHRAIEYANQYELFNPNKHASKHLSLGQIVLGLLAVMYLGVSVTFFGGVGFLMLFKPEIVEEIISNGGITVAINGESIIIDRNFSYALNGELSFIGVEAITWELIGYILAVVGIVCALGLIFVLIVLIKTKIKKVDYNHQENKRYNDRLAICREAANNAKKALNDIDKELSKI